MKKTNCIYRVIYNCEGYEKVVFETRDEDEAYYKCDVYNAHNAGFTYSYYDVDCVRC